MSIELHPWQGSILYCTTGVVLQWMRTNPDLVGYSHIILDEVMYNVDFLIDVHNYMIRFITLHLIDDLITITNKDLASNMFC